jgi:hypothetical protein
VIPIVVEAHSADVIATLILLKKDVEEKTGAAIQMTIAGATEAHLLVKEIAKANIGIIFKPSRPFPTTWEQRRLWVLRFGLGPHLYEMTRFQAAWSPTFQGDGNCAFPGTRCHRWYWH